MSYGQLMPLHATSTKAGGACTDRRTGGLDQSNQARALVSSTSIRSEASACDAAFVEAAAAAIEEAEYRRMPDDVQAVPHIQTRSHCVFTIVAEGSARTEAASWHDRRSKWRSANPRSEMRDCTCLSNVKTGRLFQ